MKTCYDSPIQAFYDAILSSDLLLVQKMLHNNSLTEQVIKNGLTWAIQANDVHIFSEIFHRATTSTTLITELLAIASEKKCYTIMILLQRNHAKAYTPLLKQSTNSNPPKIILDCKEYVEQEDTSCLSPR